MPSDRGLTWPEFEATYVAPKKPAQLFLGEGASLLVAPNASSLQLRLATDELPRTLRLPTGLVSRFVQDSSGRSLELSCAYPDLYRPFYSLCIAARDLAALGLKATQALETAISDWRNLLKSETLSVEDEIGLFGELLVLERIARLSPDIALSSWTALDTSGATHDYRIHNNEIEVKTTTSQTREHWISGPSQLLSSSGCLLFLFSIQIQAAGSTSGNTLFGLLDTISTLIPQDASRLRDAVLQRCKGADISKLERRWLLRSPILAFPVLDSFPSLTTDSVSRAVGANNSARIRDLKYLIELSGLPSSADIDSILVNSH